MLNKIEQTSCKIKKRDLFLWRVKNGLEMERPECVLIGSDLHSLKNIIIVTQQYFYTDDSVSIDD